MPDVAELYRAHRGELVGLAVSYVHDRSTAEDVVHEVFASFLTVELRNPDAAVGYLVVSTKNRALDVLRRRPPIVDGEPFESGCEPSAEDLALQRFERTDVREALRSLSRQQRAVLVLRFYGGLIVPEIAEALQVSQGTVKSHAARGKAALATVLTPTA